MINLNILETFRTKEELLNYFDLIGQIITEEEIENLKKSYEEAEANGSTLTLQQLDNVAGGSSSIYIVKKADVGEFRRNNRMRFELHGSTPSSEYSFFVKSMYMGSSDRDTYVDLKVFDAENNRVITLTPEELKEHRSDMHEALKTLVGDGTGLYMERLTYRNPDSDDPYTERKVVPYLVNYFRNGIDSFDKPGDTYEVRTHLTIFKGMYDTVDLQTAMHTLRDVPGSTLREQIQYVYENPGSFPSEVLATIADLYSKGVSPEEHNHHQPTAEDADIAYQRCRAILKQRNPDIQFDEKGFIQSTLVK